MYTTWAKAQSLCVKSDGTYNYNYALKSQVYILVPRWPRCRAEPGPWDCILQSRLKLEVFSTFIYVLMWRWRLATDSYGQRKQQPGPDQAEIKIHRQDERVLTLHVALLIKWYLLYTLAVLSIPSTFAPNRPRLISTPASTKRRQKSRLTSFKQSLRLQARGHSEHRLHFHILSQHFIGTARIPLLH
jgi:hypothetical protein